jgi:hydroxyethylthiazole kinase-like uncharacterized protein yjeF
MQPLFDDCYALDTRCYEEFGLTEDILMEHAAGGMATYIKNHFLEGSSLLIVAGMGNNGADGMVLARQLYGRYDIRLYLTHPPHSTMAKLQLERAQKVGITPIETLEDADIIVDAIFGAGLNKPLDKTMQHLIETLNNFNGHKIACDVPTGMNLQGLTPCFKADTTLTMGAHKTLLYADNYKEFIGNIHCIDLGLDNTTYTTPTTLHLLEKSDFHPPHRTQQVAHKGTFGHATLFLGEKSGAAILSALAASRFGAGLTTLVMQEKVALPYHLMASNELPANTTAIAIGMGLGCHFDDNFLEKHIVHASIPILLDADALSHPKLLPILKQTERQIVITPHPKEFSHLWHTLTGEDISVETIQKNRFEMVKKFQALYPHVTLLLKGANMLIAKTNEIYINPLGDIRLSKGGSGDILAGLIVSLMAQGYQSLEASIQGSLALTLASQKFEGANYSMLPTDIVENLVQC